MKKPYISVVVPVFNEQENLETLYQRLTTVLDDLGKPYEIILTDDGSRDNSAAILKELHERRPEQIRVIYFNGNFGQHMAIMAGFERVRGEIIISMDADLQNPPENIPKLVAAIEQGHDVVNGYRMDRKDNPWRLLISWLHNKVRMKIIPKIKMKDEGCMLRAYRRNIVDLMAASGEASTFIPALAMTYASNPTEVGVTHAPRTAGKSNYNFYRLLRYNFDLVTGFSLVPLQVFTLIGMVVSFFSALLVVYLFFRRLIIGPEVQGVFTLFAILYLLAGILLMGLGIVGEYIGRIYQEVRKRPRFVIREILDAPSNEKSTSHT